MLKTDLKTFREELLATGGYKTPAERRAPVRHKPSGLVTTRFSFAVSRVFPLCALYEAFGKLETDKWANFCFSTVTMPESLGMNVELEATSSHLRASRRHAQLSRTASSRMR